jgi:outer membrane protein OmpA-like peptidoglycan-associated protein
MRKNFWSLAGLTASLLAGTAMAQTSGSSTGDWWDTFVTGSPYVGAKIGGNWAAHGTSVGTNDYAAPVSGRVHYNDGYMGAVQAGWAFNNGFRVEVEGSEQYDPVSRVSPYGNGRGAMQNYAVMGNVLYDLPFTIPGVPLQPYIGVGLGMSDYAPHHIRGDGMVYPASIGGPSKWGMAYQGIAGVAYNLDENLALTLEYRYFSRTDQNYPQGVLNDYSSHSALIGVRYTFGAPAQQTETQAATYVPPPAPPPAPHAPASYLVFFDFNKSDLTPQATQIVDQAAANAGPAHVTQLTVTGHTDTVGSDAYNMRLSRRRAESVAAELEAKGIPSSEIQIVAKGKRDLLVPTGDGVREPQNRRVQIVYGGPTS